MLFVGFPVRKEEEELQNPIPNNFCAKTSDVLIETSTNKQKHELSLFVFVFQCPCDTQHNDKQKGASGHTKAKGLLKDNT